MINTDTTTVVCIGGSKGTVRAVCATVKRFGHRAIGVITEVNPECTLALLSMLSPHAILVSDDLPEEKGVDFAESLRRIYPDIRILLLAEDFAPVNKVTGVISKNNIDSEISVTELLSTLSRAHA